MDNIAAQNSFFAIFGALVHSTKKECKGHTHLEDRVTGPHCVELLHVCIEMSA